MKRRAVLCLALCALMFLATGCQKAEPKESPSATGGDLTSGGQTLSGGETPETENPSKEEGSVSAGAVVGKTDSAGKQYTEKDVFSYKEIEKVFGLTRADVVALYGEPKQVAKSDFENSNIETLEYEGHLFDIDFTLAPETGRVFNAEVSDEKLGLPRGLKIGDPIETVATKFPSTDTDIIVPEGDGTGYIKMYGDPTAGGAYGIIEIDGETPTAAIYSDEVTSVTFRFSDGMLASVTYTMKLN